MHFKISKRNFYSALSIVARAISSNTPIPALTGIKLEVFENEICLIGSNSDISIKHLITKEEGMVLDIIEKGAIVIEARYILEIVRKIDSNEVEVEIIDGSLTRLKGEHSEFHINGIRVHDYPIIDFTKPEKEFEIDAELLMKVIVQTSFATSDKETRPVLTGVNFKCQGKKLDCIATDSFRLARKTVYLNEDNDFNITIPAKSLAEVVKSIESNKTVKIAVSDKKIQFYLDKTLIQTRLIDGDYPETERLIPVDFTNEFVLDSRDILNAIDRASFIKNDGISIIKLKANREEFVVSSRSQEVGSSTETITNYTCNGDEIEISFSGKYVFDAVRALEATEIKISFSGDMKPFIIRNTKDDSTLQLVLPVRTYI